MEKTALQIAAAEFAAAFETRKRDTGEEFTTLKDDAPEWMTETVHSAHGDMLPDDWRYRMIGAVADAMGEMLSYDADADLAEGGEALDGLVPVYTADQLAWLASRNDRMGYCDEANEECNVTGASTMSERIAAGIYLEYREIWDAVATSLQGRADATESK